MIVSKAPVSVRLEVDGQVSAPIMVVNIRETTSKQVIMRNLKYFFSQNDHPNGQRILAEIKQIIKRFKSICFIGFLLSDCKLVSLDSGYCWFVDDKF